MYKKEWEDLMNNAESTAPLLDYPERIATTWMISFKAIQRQHPIAAKLLKLWAFFDYRNMSYAIFQDTADHIIARWFANRGDRRQRPQLLDDVVNIIGGKAKFLNAAKFLLDYSMIEVQEEVGGASYAIHPVVHRWALYIQDAHQKRKYLLSALIIAGARGIKPLEYASREQVEEHPNLVPHVDQCWSQLLKDENITASDEWKDTNMVIIPELRSLALLFFSQSRYLDAERLFLLALKGSRQSAELGPTHPCTLSLTGDLASLYRGQGRLQEAMQKYAELLSGIEKSDREMVGFRFVVDTFSQAAAFLNQINHQDKAEELYAKLLSISQTLSGLQSPDTLSLKKNLAMMHQSHGQLNEAEALFLQVLNGTSRTLQTEDLRTFFDAVDNLLTLRVKLRSITVERFEEILLLSVETREAIYGGGHPQTLVAYESAARFYFNRRLLRKAYLFARMALKGLRTLYGANTPSTHKMVVLLFAIAVQGDYSLSVRIPELELRVKNHGLR